MGNLLGRIGSGKKIIMMDSHTDAVGVATRKNGPGSLQRQE